MSTATLEQKQETKQAYIKSVQDKITFLANGWAKVPSSNGKGYYIVTVEQHNDIPGRLAEATDCGCFAAHKDNNEHHFCKHQEAVNRRIERDRAAKEQEEFKVRAAEYAKQQQEWKETQQERCNVTTLPRKTSTVEAGLAPWLKDAMNGRSRNGYLSGKAS